MTIDQVPPRQRRRAAPIASPVPNGLVDGVRILTARDPGLARIVAEHGMPSFARRPANFGTLLHIILEQQLSIDVAARLWLRLREECRPLTPRRFLGLDDATLKRCGFTRQKIGYARDLAAAILARRFSPRALARLDDNEALAAITALRGFGAWSAEVFLLFAEGRPDIWPAEDLGLRVAVQWLKDLPERPTGAYLRSLGEAWRPWRSVAACLLWQLYLKRLNRAPPVLPPL
ncbi:MAG TPA: DNA-3-methyladenine glycosylase 2 family protein [Stellaceae bacterium]|nr:DNA-3-methyladenine glycosylase 2 family protein [Stellaceae bacterium]